MNIGLIFENEPLKHRALSLYAEDACEIVELHLDEVIARVKGRSNIYWSTIFRKNSTLYFDCSCPSDYYPCKHAGALLYTLRDRCLNPAKGAGSSIEHAEPHFEQKPLTPGELLNVVEVGRDGNQRFNMEDFFFKKDGFGEKEGNISTKARFRPAFRFVQTWDPYRPMKRVVGIEPVLVYLRKDGSDGRLEKFSPGKERLPGDGATELLLRMCASVEGRTRRASELLKTWYARSLQQGYERLKAPVELYVERAERLEREKPARLREISRIIVKWSATHILQERIEYSPLIFLRDAEDYEEFFDDTRMLQESDGELFLLSNPGTGSLWYLFDSLFTREEPGRVHILSSVFTLPRSFGVNEVRGFTDACRSRYSGLIEVEELPENIRLLTIVPTPIVDFDRPSAASRTAFASRTVFYQDDESTSLQLRFRYGNKHERTPGSRELIRIDQRELELLTGTVPVSEDALYYIAPMEEAEKQFIELLGSILTQHGFPLQVGAWRNPFVDKHWQPASRNLLSQFSDFVVTSELYEVVSAVVENLTTSGFEVRLQKEKVRRPPGPKSVRISSSGEEWLDIEPGFETENGFIPIERIHSRGLVEAGGKKFVLPPGTDVELILSQLRDKRVGHLDLAALEELIDEISNPDHPGLQDFLSLRKKLASFTGLEESKTPKSFQGRLRPYQRNGLSWLWFLHSYGLGGCLADDMGLGKTIQTLALLAKAREKKEMRRALVVCPVSTLGNWRQEINKFTPHFSVQTHSGPGRGDTPESFDEADIVLVGYATQQRDAELLRRVDFDYLILDEAQALKNPKTKRRRAVASLDIPHRIALTGTPIENSVVELWSLLDILMPGILGNRSTFTRRYGKAAEEDAADPSIKMNAGAEAESKIGSNEREDGAARLRRLIRPLVLRRTKKVVAPELPPKEEFVHYAEAGTRQADVYESLRIHFVEEVQSLIQSGERTKSAFKILEAMLRLRQAAILPALVDRDYADVPSAKLDILYDRLIELGEEGNKALVFSQFTGVLDEVERRLADTELTRFRLDGSTPRKQRERDIAGFQACDGTAAFLISLKAGGLGINLTAADYVFLLDPWWNPAVESQAIDRAHRIGRRSPVFAYRLVTQGTIEEKMLRLQERKRRISESLIRGESGALRDLSNEDILGLFR